MNQNNPQQTASESVQTSDNGKSIVSFRKILILLLLVSIAEGTLFSSTSEIVVRRKWQSGRKPSFKPEYIPALRILRNDIRRRYGDMYINVVNSNDPDLTRRFFYQFGVPNFTYLQNINDDGNGLSQFIRSLYSGDQSNGINQFVNGMIGILRLFSDGVTRLLNFEVRVTQGVPGSRLIGIISYQASLMYDVFRPSQNPNGSPVPDQSIEFTDVTTNENIYLTLLPQPVPLRMKSRLILTLDENHRITSLSLSPILG
jgi:hypothetical protein